MKKTLIIISTYIVVALIFDCIINIVMQYVHSEIFESTPEYVFMLFFSCWIIGASAVGVLHHFILKRCDCNKEAITNAAFYIKIRAVLLIATICIIFTTAILQFPEIANTKAFTFTQDDSVIFRYTLIARICKLYYSFNFVTYIPLLFILVSYINKMVTKSRSTNEAPPL